MNTHFESIQREIEEVFRSRVQNLGLSFEEYSDDSEDYFEDAYDRGDIPDNQEYLTEQAAFFVGAAAALQVVFGPDGAGNLTKAVPPLWILSIMSGRDILAWKESSNVEG